MRRKAPHRGGPEFSYTLGVVSNGEARMDKELCPLCGNNEIDPETEENCEECEETARDHGKKRED